ncbi:hypothetical protein [Endozoicomonas numazuensis]|uniref:Uncharacterized protein n=1 Tax=Endozoicomonas numazuensis TaxID=1137799 RepID=A0A081NJD1_9GAMM|nr:hypothetical protein [Endozoicomonas numazuensis]KEQ18554.1 hypothetical protein GZ78_13920 [Endozoicomonas numazuensis]
MSGLKTAAYVAAMPLRGALVGASVTTSVVGAPGAAVGWLAGKPVSKVVEYTGKGLNKLLPNKWQINAKKHADRTVKAFQFAGAVALSLPTYAVITSANPLVGKLLGMAPTIGAGINLVKGISSAMKVYDEYRNYGFSLTKNEDLYAPVFGLYPNLYKGDSIGDFLEKNDQWHRAHNQLRREHYTRSNGIPEDSVKEGTEEHVSSNLSIETAPMTPPEYYSQDNPQIVVESIPEKV